MPAPAIFTSSAGGDIGGAGAPHKTRFKGPLRIGTVTTAPTMLVDPHGSTGGTGGGSAASPLYSFALRPEAGLYLATITSSNPEIRLALVSADVFSWTTAGIAVVSSGSTGTAGFGSTAGTNPVVFITQTTVTAVPGTVAPASQSGAALSWDSGAKTIEVFSTVTGAWMRMHSSSGVTIVFSSS